MQTNTDYKKMKKALQESNECFRATFEQVAIGLTHLAPDGRFLRVNKKFCDIVGYSRDELLERTCQEITYPDDLEPDFSCIRRLLTESSNSYTMDKRYIRKGGELVWTDVTFSLVLDEAEEPLWFVSVVQDISQRKQTEAALQNSESKYKTLLENLPQKIFLKDTHLTYISCNENYARDLGIMPEEIAGKTDYCFFPRELADKYRGDDQRILESGRAERLEEQYVQDGKTTWVAIIKTPIRDGKGTVTGILGIFLNITEQKRMHDELLASEEKFRTLVTNTEEIVYMIAKDGTFLLSEGKGLSKLGLEPGQVVGKSVFDLYKDYPDMLDDMRRAFNGETVTEEVNVNGNYFRSWYTPHKNNEDEIIGLLGLSVNITEQRQAENKLQEYQQRLRALASELTLTEERARRDIALELHDQVGQSLAVMRIQLAVAQKESDGRKGAAILDEVSDSLRQAIQDTRNVISDLSPPLINELSLSATLSEWLKDKIGKRCGLESKFIDDGDPKPLSENTKVILFRSVRELLTNVVKHANANRVSVSLQRRGSAVRIVVEDDGVGLVDGRRPQDDSGEGGFGLFSIEERMSDINGAFEIGNHPGRGVRAILTAPLDPERSG